MSFELTMRRGDERVIEVAVTLNGNAQSLAGKGLTFTAKRSFGGASVFTKTIGSGITVTNAAAGFASILISPSDTSGFADQVGLVCDLQMDNNPGSPVTIASGTLTVLPDIS